MVSSSVLLSLAVMLLTQHTTRKENGQVRVCVGLEVTVNPQQLESETQVKTLVFMCDLTLT